MFTVAVVGCVAMGGAANAIDIVWDGGEGNWEDSNWNGGENLFDLVGQENGSNGYKSGVNPDEEEVFIIGGAGSIVNYDADALASDLRLKQGAYLTINDGGILQQISNDDWVENRWTEMDLSALTLDNGIFRRIGEVGPEGGGALIFGSWRGDDNLDVSPLDYQQTEISITNGGRLENQGQLWFGSWGDTAANGTTITMEINNGTVDLTGGDVSIGELADGDLVFTNRFIDDFDLPTYAINFTGPGSIIVDNAGIINASMNEDGEWQNLDPVTYEDLWDEGILQADGMSGLDGLSFSNFFSVTGSLGEDDYTLTRSVLVGDFDNSGALDAADIDMLSAAVRDGNGAASFDLNNDGNVDAADRSVWVVDLKKTYFGDSNLDSEFNSGDFVVVFQSQEYEDGVPKNSSWATGDWNGDGDFDSGDFVSAFQGEGYEKGPRATAAVPEPSTSVLIVGSILILGQVMRRRNK
jgi:hypothetical protein